MVVSSMLRPDLEPADRFDLVMACWNRLVGQEAVSFDNTSFLSAYRNAAHLFSHAWYLKHAGGFPEHVKTAVDLQREVEYYIQMNCMKLSTVEMAMVAGTLANGGTNPVTRLPVFSNLTVQHCLSLMFSCGMYDYSGEFAYGVGIPAKSNLEGMQMLVIPNVMGIAIWSPTVNDRGHSTRGLAFAKELVSLYGVHAFDSSVRMKKKKLTSRIVASPAVVAAFEMCEAGAAGSIAGLRRLLLRNVSPNVADYDGRTALHLAAEFSQMETVNYLLIQGADMDKEDRWGVTPRAILESKGFDVSALSRLGDDDDATNELTRKLQETIKDLDLIGMTKTVLQTKKGRRKTNSAIRSPQLLPKSKSSSSSQYSSDTDLRRKNSFLGTKVNGGNGGGRGCSGGIADGVEYSSGSENVSREETPDVQRQMEREREKEVHRGEKGARESADGKGAAEGLDGSEKIPDEEKGPSSDTDTSLHTRNDCPSAVGEEEGDADAEGILYDKKSNDPAHEEELNQDD